MPSIDRTSIVLDEVETTIRQLLLDVVDFIEKNPVSKAPDTSASKVHIPADLAKSPLQLRWTGGWVRDKLLKVGSKDIDIAINKMTGYQFGLRMKEYLDQPSNAEKYHVAGVDDAVNAKLHKIEANPDKSKNLETTATRIFGLDLDLVNLRKETYTADSRNPVIEFGTPEEDSLRRDATINAMFYNIHTSLVEDFTGRGLEDLDQGIIRTPLEPTTTFVDDPLRVLRLIRFATRYNYDIDKATYAAMGNEEIKKALLAKITRERVWQEIEKMLKGPDPKSALSHIDHLGLYDAIFLGLKPLEKFDPPTLHWSKCYNLVAKLVTSKDADPYTLLRAILVQSPEEAFQSWLMASLIPWTDAPEAPPLKSGRPSPPPPSLVLRDGLKAPTKLSDLASLSVQNGPAIRKLIESRSQERGTLGMQIRSWGATWRQQVLFSLLSEVFEKPDQTSRLVSSYDAFLRTCQELDILEAYDMKPILNGKELCESLGLKPGTWTKTALDVVMAWQLRNPQTASHDAALTEIRAWKETANIDQDDQGPPLKKTKKQGELTSVLTSHFLQLTLRPIFSQTPRNPDLTAAGRRAINASTARDMSHVFDDSIRPWKFDQSWSLDLLSWICKNLDVKGVERNWGLLVPPVLTVLDDTDVRVKTRGCVLMRNLLEATPSALLARTGLGPVFEESLTGCTTYLPSLTAEIDSIEILNAAYPALVSLGETLYPLSQSAVPSDARSKYFNSILRKCLLAGYRHAGDNVRIASTLLSHMPAILRAMGIDSVVHLKNTIPLLTNILADPFAPASPPLAVAAVEALKSVIECGWPRIGGWRVDILKGVCKLWINLGDETSASEIRDLQMRLKDIMVGLTSAVLVGDVARSQWRSDLKVLLRADDRLAGLLNDTLQQLKSETANVQG